MITTVAFYLLIYCAGVLLLAGGLRLLGRRFRGLTRRMVAVFGVFALTAAYVWIDLGPEVDHLIAHHQEQAPLLPPEPRQIPI